VTSTLRPALAADRRAEGKVRAAAVAKKGGKNGSVPSRGLGGLRPGWFREQEAIRKESFPNRAKQGLSERRTVCCRLGHGTCIASEREYGERTDISWQQEGNAYLNAVGKT